MGVPEEASPRRTSPGTCELKFGRIFDLSTTPTAPKVNIFSTQFYRIQLNHIFLMDTFQAFPRSLLQLVNIRLVYNCHSLLKINYLHPSAIPFTTSTASLTSSFPWECYKCIYGAYRMHNSPRKIADLLLAQQHRLHSLPLDQFQWYRAFQSSYMFIQASVDILYLRDK